jgi:hypothetical protein
MEIAVGNIYAVGLLFFCKHIQAFLAVILRHCAAIPAELIDERMEKTQINIFLAFQLAAFIQATLVFVPSDEKRRHLILAILPVLQRTQFVAQRRIVFPKRSLPRNDIGRDYRWFQDTDLHPERLGRPLKCRQSAKIRFLFHSKRSNFCPESPCPRQHCPGIIESPLPKKDSDSFLGTALDNYILWPAPRSPLPIDFPKPRFRRPPADFFRRCLTAAVGLCKN